MFSWGQLYVRVVPVSCPSLPYLPQPFVEPSTRSSFQTARSTRKSLLCHMDLKLGHLSVWTSLLICLSPWINLVRFRQMVWICLDFKCCHIHRDMATLYFISKIRLKTSFFSQRHKICVFSVIFAQLLPLTQVPAMEVAVRFFTVSLIYICATKRRIRLFFLRLGMFLFLLQDPFIKEETLGLLLYYKNKFPTYHLIFIYLELLCYWYIFIFEYYVALKHFYVGHLYFRSQNR